jgi:DNA invertase Pin-like site-specific DNA recombinase
MSEESRLGREAIEVSFALKQLVQAGVRVFCYLTDTERTLNSPIEKATLALQAMSDEMESERARQRVGDAIVRKARAGEVTGERIFGYTNVDATGQPVIPGVSRARRRAINESEAAVIH